MKTLCVIDMQQTYVPKTATFAEEVITNCIHLIKRYKKQNMPIVLVEFTRGRRIETISEIYSLVRGYEHLYIVRKNKMSGAKKLLSILDKNELPKNLEFCGVNWHQCVAATICDILSVRQDYKIAAYKNASNPKYWSKPTYWKDVKRDVKFKYIKSRKRD